MANLNKIKNIIFDLGGVIIDLDLPAAYKAFAALSELSVDDVVEKTSGLMLFTDYEQGLVSSDDFRQQISNLLGINAPEAEIDRAWCAMLGEISVDRLQLLIDLKKKYRIFALSNTNHIHAEKFDAIAQRSNGNDGLFAEYFHKVYYSHLMRQRKPDVGIYRTVLDDQELEPGETLFIDDNLENIRGASSLGILTFHLQQPEQLITYFNGDQ